MAAREEALAFAFGHRHLFFAATQASKDREASSKTLSLWRQGLDLREEAGGLESTEPTGPDDVCLSLLPNVLQQL